MLVSRIVITSLSLFSLLAQADDLAPFTSDGCSSFPNGNFEQKQLWLSCCEAHDYAYWKGGTYKERLSADEALRKCVAAVGEPEIATIMLAGVRVGGTPYLPTKFRWGYGWPYPRGYKALGPVELNLVEEMEKCRINAKDCRKGDGAKGKESEGN